MSSAIYRAYGPHDSAADAWLVTVTRDGIESPLRHVVRHSPTGMTWAHAGSGPADLALSLLVDALGNRAHCCFCAGTSQVAITVDAPSGVPFVVPFDGHVHGWDAGEQDRRGFSVQRCGACKQGLVVLPYQQFKRDHISRWPQSGWTITQAQVLAWYSEVTSPPEA